MNAAYSKQYASRVRYKEVCQQCRYIEAYFQCMLQCSIRGGFRKFCHRCYNFVNIHDRLLYYTLIERATFLLYNDAKTMHERNKYFEIHALKDTWGKPTGTFS